jgi:hypothetical protein
MPDACDGPLAIADYGRRTENVGGKGLGAIDMAPASNKTQLL